MVTNRSLLNTTKINYMLNKHHHNNNTRNTPLSNLMRKTKNKQKCAMGQAGPGVEAHCYQGRMHRGVRSPPPLCQQ